MITWQEIDDAIGRIITESLNAAGYPAARIRNDVSEPVARRSYRIDLSNTDDMGTEIYAERGMDIEIYYYPQEKERPKDELNEVSQLLKAALRSGVAVSDMQIELSDSIEADVSDGILALMFRLEWIETAEEEGETMNELIFNEKEVVNGGYDA